MFSNAKRDPKYILVPLFISCCLSLTVGCSNDTIDNNDTVDTNVLLPSLPAYFTQLYHQIGDETVYYDERIEPYESYKDKHILSIDNLNDYDYDASMFVLLNGEIISFTANEEEATSFYNFTPSAGVETQLPIYFGIDEAMLKYSLNQCDIIIMLNTPKNDLNDIRFSDFFTTSFTFYFENKNSNEKMAPVYDSDNVSPRSKGLKKLANNSARAIITSEEVIAKDDCYDVFEVDSSFYFLFGGKSDLEAGANYAYFLLKMKSGLLELDEPSCGIVYLAKGEMFQKKFHFSSEKTEECVFYAVVVPLTFPFNFAFHTMRTLC